MDRELVLAILAALLCGGALTLVGWYPARSPVTGSGRTLERRAWRRLWLPFVPAVLLFAALCGWALVEPADAEPVPACLLWAAVPFASVMVRAACRAVRSLVSARQDYAVATVGLFRPRIVVSARVAEALDAPALVAAIAHERAHVRHRDPLRLWLAQLGSDLLWPWPAAYARFRCWRQALELARDEEVRIRGVAGMDLAAAIVTALRFNQSSGAPGAATLGGDASFAAARIARLLRPLESTATPVNRGALWPLAVAVGVSLAVLLGRAYGECVVRSFLAVV
ncbi:MAG TPA: M56 family metallopeptidase [Candidatus Margulisiibacteriota bacterium]|nr:M56 family metallopeptidase [Candidatus Margulisiibacteriota bacterium]